MTISLLQHTQGIEGYQHERYEYSPGEVTAHIVRKKNKFYCSGCRSQNVTATLVGERRIKALPMGTRQLTFLLKTHRLRCHDCRAYLMENIPFISGSHGRMTKALERSIIDLRKHMCIKAVAGHFDVDWGSVKDVEKKYLNKKFEHIPLRHVTAIGIDEVFLGPTIGKKGYLTIVRDMHSGAVLFVGKGRSAATLKDFTRKLRRSKAKIKVIAMDMGQSFTSWAKENVPKATIVYDHFHVIKLMNDKLSQVRRRTMKELDENERKALKGKRWHFVMNQENLSLKAKLELEQCKQTFDELSTVHYLKESLRNIYSMADSKVCAEIAFERWYAMAIESEIPEMKTMAGTIKKNIKGILAYWDTDGMTSAAMEGFNNKIGWLTRQAYGYRDEEYLILKIYDLPTLKIERIL